MRCEGEGMGRFSKLWEYGFRCKIVCHPKARTRDGRGDRQAKMLWAVVCLFSLSLIRCQTTRPSLSLDTPLALSANNFSSSTPLLFSLPASSQLSISLALCAAESSSSPNFTLFIAPLDAGLSSLPQTACAVRARVNRDSTVAQSAQVLAEQMWLRDERGWRREWL